MRTLPGGSPCSLRYSPTSIWNSSDGSVSAAGRCGRWYAPLARTTASAARSPVGRLEDEPCPLSRDRADLDVLSHGRSDVGRVALQIADDLVAGHESVRVRPVVDAVGQADEPVGRHEAEAVPAISPGLADAAPLEDDVLDAGLGQLAARGEARLTGADDGHGSRLGSSHASTLPPARGHERRSRSCGRMLRSILSRETAALTLKREEVCAQRGDDLRSLALRAWRSSWSPAVAAMIRTRAKAPRPRSRQALRRSASTISRPTSRR